ncbi:DUF5362 domain-containing protein [Planctomycetota bacterium]
MSDDIRLKERSCHVDVPPVSSEVEESADPTIPGLAQQARAPHPEPAQMSIVRFLDEPLWRARGWMKLLGVLFIINGVMMILSLWGIILCWIPIWMGVTLFSAANHVRSAAEMDDQVMMKAGLEKIALFFKINGIMFLVCLGLAILMFVAMAMGFIGSTALMSQQFPMQ